MVISRFQIKAGLPSQASVFSMKNDVNGVGGACICNTTEFRWNYADLECAKVAEDSGLPTYAWVLIACLIVIVIVAGVLGLSYIYQKKFA